jgi:exonuclease VII large subunit
MEVTRSQGLARYACFPRLFLPETLTKVIQVAKEFFKNFPIPSLKERKWAFLLLTGAFFMASVYKIYKQRSTISALQKKLASVQSELKAKTDKTEAPLHEQIARFKQHLIAFQKKNEERDAELKLARGYLTSSTREGGGRPKEDMASLIQKHRRPHYGDKLELQVKEERAVEAFKRMTRFFINGNLCQEKRLKVFVLEGLMLVACGNQIWACLLKANESDT